MRIRFDHNQGYQTDAVSAVVDLFEGQPLATGQFEVGLASEFGGAMSELGIGNALALEEAAILTNLQKVQKRNDLALSDALDGLNFSVEMETGTGKTYVYLRTIHELRRKYGFTKFIIVVPSVAIREGVLKNLELTRDHFASLYDNPPIDFWVYDSRQVSRLRHFAASNTLQVLVMNIDAFNKSQNVIGIESDRLSGRRPLEFVQAARPVVIIDEPQNMESETARAAIESLNPLCTLRYSATHRNRYNLVYRLDPVRAYDLDLVKRIEVASVLETNSFNAAFAELVSVDLKKTTLSAKLLIDVATKGGVKRKSVTVGGKSWDVQALSGGRDVYAGFTVQEIDPDNGSIRFGNGIQLFVGQRTGADQDMIMRAQIEKTVEIHLEREARLRGPLLDGGPRMKVLSLIFLDRVAHYFDEDGKVRRWFVEAYRRLSARPEYAHLDLPPVERVHNGYFAMTKATKNAAAVAKDTSGKTVADDEAYELIMRDKERLMDPEEPLRFVFSHSALREGWDNPNVFQICTLRESKSEVKKRQEIGRGLRLPVDETGRRVKDPGVNRLVVIANESYASFAAALQNEIQSECGVSFEGRVKNHRERRVAQLSIGWESMPAFLELWEHIKHRTRYSVNFATDDLVRAAAEKVWGMPLIESPQIRTEQFQLDVTAHGVTTRLRRAGATILDTRPVVPDLLTHLQSEVEVTRATLVRILKESGRLPDARRNPQQFLFHASQAIRHALRRIMIQGIEYELVQGAESEWDMRLFIDHPEVGYESDVVSVKKSIYDAIRVDSKVEREFAIQLDGRDDILCFLKLPPWFTVDTPIGKYNPDWAVAKQTKDEKAMALYLIYETKGNDDPYGLRPSEEDKVRCGERHFRKLKDVRFARVSAAAQV